MLRNLAFCAALALLVGPAAADENQSVAASLQLPASESYLELRADFPRTARVSSQFDYEIIVKNVSDQVVLHNVKLVQQTPDGFHVESAQMVEQKKKQRDSSAQGQQKKKESQDEQQKEKQGRKHDGGQQEKKAAAAKSWTIDELAPGESRRIRITASSDKEGTGSACIAVASYTPVLCIATKFVAPELEIVKQAPETATVCDTIEYEYVIRNNGSAPAKNFDVIDKLPDGLFTIDGKEQLKFTVDSLQPGEARKFVASLAASKPGEYNSRAVARLQDGQEVRSKRVSTKVEEANLTVNIRGPQVEYLDRPMTFHITVENDGNADAKGTRLTVTYPDDLQIIQTGEQEARDPQGQQAKQNREGIQFMLGTLPAGQSRTVQLTTRSNSGGEKKIMARTTFECQNQLPQAQEAVTAQTHFTAKVLALPALQVIVVDEADPVRVGDDAVYHVVVRNEGDAADEQIEVLAELPEGLSFQKATGATKVTSDGNQLTMEPVDTLAAGEEAQWTIRTKAEEPGEAILKVDLQSKSLSQSATTEEPTRLFDSESEKQPKDSQSSNKDSGSK